MSEKTYKVVDVRGLAEKLYAIQQTEDELSFATCFEADDDGKVLESSTGDWWGAKFDGAFDGTYLIIGGFGGGDWYAYDATTTLTVDELEEMMYSLFKKIAAKSVCVEEGREDE